MTRDNLLGTSLLAWGGAALLALYLLVHPAAGSAGRPWGVVVGLIGLGLILLARRPWAWPILAAPFALALLPTGPAAAALAGAALLAALLALGPQARRQPPRRPAHRCDHLPSPRFPAASARRTWRTRPRAKFPPSASVGTKKRVCSPSDTMASVPEEREASAAEDWEAFNQTRPANMEKPPVSQGTNKG